MDALEQVEEDSFEVPFIGLRSMLGSWFGLYFVYRVSDSVFFCTKD